MSARLTAFVGQDEVATILHDQQSGAFDLEYSAAWAARPLAFPLSPVLPLQRPATGYMPGAVRRFLENLLPEGPGLDFAASLHQVAKSNVFGLIAALGRETAGALSLRVAGASSPAYKGTGLRELGSDELRQRILARHEQPFAVWDGRVRLSVPGYQDKLPVFMDEQRRLFLAEPPMASTHILKPEPQEIRLGQLVANEHYCLALARAIGLPAAEADILRVPEPVLAVRRFDRYVHQHDSQLAVEKRHIIDGCQALDLSVSAKYERQFGSGRDVLHLREGASLQRLFAVCDAHAVAKAQCRLRLLQWILFNYLIGNFDAHGKNVSFFLRPAGIDIAPFYDLVSVAQYEHLTSELAMAIGDEFEHGKVGPYDFAELAERCQLPATLVAREMKRIVKRAREAVSAAPANGVYEGSDEQMMVDRIREFVSEQCGELFDIAVALPEVAAQ